MKPIKSVAVPLTRGSKSASRAAASAAAAVAFVEESEGPRESHAAVSPARKSHASLAAAQPSHRFHIGERLRMMNGGRTLARVEAFCRVTAALPYEGRGALLYRVKSEAEQFERVVAEADLSRKVDEWT